VTDIKSFSLHIDNLTFDVYSAGAFNDNPIIFLHGFPETSDAWNEIMLSLAVQKNYCIAYNQRGYSRGAILPDVDSYQTHLMVDDLLKIADELKISRFHLVGHDWGGAVAWLAAILNPKRLLSLTVVSTPHPLAFVNALSKPETGQATKSSYMEFFRQSQAEEALLANEAAGLKALFSLSGLNLEIPRCKEKVDIYVKTLTIPGAMTGALNWYRATLPAEIVSKLGKVKVPTLYVWSTNDVALGKGAAFDTYNYVDGPYRFEILESISHWVPEEAPEKLSELIGQHVKANSSI
jgi:pimeloyl-ACP methyl ester carboxylesterase